MKNKMKIGLTFILLLLLGEGYSQVGYQGKRHYVNFDMAGLLLNSEVAFKYNYVLKNHCALIAGIQTKNIQNDNEIKVSESEHDILKGYQKKVRGYSLGFIYGNEGITNMPVPMSYYIGFIYEKNNGTLYNRVKEFDYENTNPNFEEYNYKFKERRFGVVSGKGIYIGEGFFLDLMVGISLVSYKFDYDFLAENNPIVVRESWPLKNVFATTSTFFGDSPSIALEPNFEAKISYMF